MSRRNDPISHDSSQRQREEPREKSSQKTTILLVGGGVLACLCILCLLAAGGFLYFRKGSPLPVITQQKPPHYGVYLKKDGRLEELPVSQGGPGEVAVSTSEASPTLVVWLQDVDLSLLFLAPKDERDTRGVPYQTTPKGDNVLELVPATPLNSGDYCLRQGNIMMPPNMIPYWCFMVVAEGASSGQPGRTTVAQPSATPLKAMTGLQVYPKLLAEAKIWKEDVQACGLWWVRGGWTLGVYSTSSKAVRNYDMYDNGEIKAGGVIPDDREQKCGAIANASWLGPAGPFIDISAIRIDSDAAQATVASALSPDRSASNISLAYPNDVLKWRWRVTYDDSLYGYVRADNGILIGHTKQGTKASLRAPQDIAEVARSTFGDGVALCKVSPQGNLDPTSSVSPSFEATLSVPGIKKSLFVCQSAFWVLGIVTFDLQRDCSESCKETDPKIEMDKVRIDWLQAANQAVQIFGEGRQFEYALVQGSSGPQWVIVYGGSYVWRSGKWLVISAVDGKILTQP